jgi:very-short-patch-repair endonuclease
MHKGWVGSASCRSRQPTRFNRRREAIDVTKIAPLPTFDKALSHLWVAFSNEAQRKIDDFNRFSSGCESPIERLLLAGLFGLDWASEPIHWSGKPPTGNRSFPGYFGYLQAPVGAYRADILIEDATASPSRYLVVECDGHDFHERTKAQAAHDKKRDRWMTSNGYTVLRFTGSEIYADPDACASEIQRVLWQ